MEETSHILPRRYQTPSPNDWENYRTTITHLYIDCNMSLSRIIQYMHSEHGFHTTTKMYKRRFTIWKLRKNMSAEHVLRAVDHVPVSPGHHSANSIDSTDMKKQKEYFRRLPAERRRDLLSTVMEPLNAMSSTIVPSPVSHVLVPPGDLLVPEYYMHLLNTYVKGSSGNDNNTEERWPLDETSGFKNEDTVPAWCSSVMMAVGALKEGGKDAEARRFIHCFLQQTPQQLSRQDPLLFLFIYTSALSFATIRPDVAQRFLQDVHNVSETLPWAISHSSHPLRLLIQLMYWLGPLGIVAHASKIMLVYIDMIHKTLGAPYPIVQDMMSDTLSRLVHYKLANASDVVDLGRRMVLAAELQNQDRCKDHLNLKMHLADAYLQTGNCRDGRRIAREIMDARNASIRSERMMPSLYMLMCRIDETEGREEDALESCLRAVVASIETFGKSSDWTVKSLRFYQQRLEKDGRMEEAQSVQRDYESMFHELCSRTEGLCRISCGKG